MIMKCYMLTVFLYDDYAHVVVSKEGKVNKFDSLTFDIKAWFNEHDWYKIMRVVEFFDAEYVCISPRFDNADDFTSPEPTVVDCDVEYAARERNIFNG